jgi:hypothetical protein
MVSECTCTANTATATALRLVRTEKVLQGSSLTVVSQDQCDGWCQAKARATTTATTNSSAHACDQLLLKVHLRPAKAEPADRGCCSQLQYIMVLCQGFLVPQ